MSERWKWVKRVVLIVVSLLLFTVLVGPFLIPIPPLADTVPPAQLADPDSRFVEVNGLTVHYKVAGDGEPTWVLLHGFASSVFSWREVMVPLAEMEEIGRVIAFDRPAFGLTERPLLDEWTGENPYTPEAQVALTVGLMDALGVSRATLVGNSAGGAVAMRVALAHPERVDALVLVDAAVYSGGGTPALVRPLLNTPQMRRLGPLIARRIQGWGTDFARSAWHDPAQITPEVWEGYLKPLRAEHWDQALWELTRSSSNAADLSDRLPELTLPCLVITGDDDRIVPTEQSVRLAQELPDAELVIAPDCGHVPHEECPAVFLSAVGAFAAGMR